MTSEGKRFPLSSAALAGTLENLVTYPFEMVKTQLQLQVKSSGLYAGSDKFAGPLDCFARTLRTTGVLGLYNGGQSCGQQGAQQARQAHRQGPRFGST